LGSALLDRIELRVPVHTPVVLTASGNGEEKSAEIRQRVVAAVEMQRERFKGLEIGGLGSLGFPIRRNSRVFPGHIEKFCPLTKEAEEAFGLAAAKLSLSGRACHGILKVARTIADLAGKELIDTVHILEAVQHRRFGDDAYDILTL